MLASKLAFREVIDAAIELGAHVGVGVYSHSGQKRLRDVTIPAIIQRQDAHALMVDYDRKLQRFGASLVSDGKDDVCHDRDHLINYLTVCPDGYRFELSRDVTGLCRKSEWVADDLLAHLGEIEGTLKVKLEAAICSVEELENEQLQAAEQE